MRKSKIVMACFTVFTLMIGIPTRTCADIETVSPGVAVSGATTTIIDDLPASESTIEPTVEPASESEAEESVLGMDPEVNMYPLSDLNESMPPAQEGDLSNMPDGMNGSQLDPLIMDEGAPLSDEDAPEGEIIVTIPPTINFSRERTEHCNLSISVRGLDSYSSGSIAVEVFVSSKNGFVLSDGKHSIDYGVYSSGSTVPLTNGCQAARFTSDGSQDLIISIIEETPQYGRYTDIQVDTKCTDNLSFIIPYVYRGRTIDLLILGHGDVIVSIAGASCTLQHFQPKIAA